MVYGGYVVTCHVDYMFIVVTVVTVVIAVTVVMVVMVVMWLR